MDNEKRAKDFAKDWAKEHGFEVIDVWVIPDGISYEDSVNGDVDEGTYLCERFNVELQAVKDRYEHKVTLSYCLSGEDETEVWSPLYEVHDKHIGPDPRCE